MPKMKRSGLAAALCGVLAGACNGLFGGGAGMLLTPLLQKFTDVEEDALFPTVLASVLPLCLVSLGVYALRGALPLGSAWPYLIGSSAGGVLAGLLGKRIPVRILHKALGAILLWGAWRAIF